MESKVFSVTANIIRSEKKINEKKRSGMKKVIDVENVVVSFGEHRQ